MSPIKPPTPSVLTRLSRLSVDLKIALIFGFGTVATLWGQTFFAESTQGTFSVLSILECGAIMFLVVFSLCKLTKIANPLILLTLTFSAGFVGMLFFYG